MNYRLAKKLGIKKPMDGYTPEESKIEVMLTKLTISGLYAKLPTSRMKFIVAARFELGYPQQLIAEMLGVKQSTLFDEIELIKKILCGKPYRPKEKSEVKPEEVERLAQLLLTP